MAEVIDPLKLKGTVVWFDVNSGFGYITPANGGENISVHYSSINPVGFRSLSAGDSVEFNVTVGDDGRKRAVNVSVSGEFSGDCFNCGEFGHMAINCKRNDLVKPRSSCEVIGHICVKCPATELDPFYFGYYDFKRSKLASGKPFLPLMALPSDIAMQDNQNISDELLDSMNSEEEEKEAESKENTEKEIIKEFQMGEYRSWAELPPDTLLLVFKKIESFEILTSVQYVCKPWRQLSHEPQLWRCINMTEGDPDFIIAAAVNMSKGCLEEFYTNSYMSDVLIANISERAPLLRCLRLVSVKYMTDNELTEAVTRFPLLEELEISFSYFSSNIVNMVGQAYPYLKSFKLNGYLADFYKSRNDSGQYDDIVALSIAKHMRRVTHLQLIQNTLTNTGLLAILDCPNIQYLDIRRCFNVNMNEHLMKKCALLKNVRFPNDSTADYEFKELLNEHDQIQNCYDSSGYDEYYADCYIDWLG